jgi:hypothetical protein
MSTLVPPEHPASAASAAAALPSPVEAVVAAAVARLSDTLPPRVHVAAFPDNPDAFDFEGHASAALVLYDGSRFDEAGLGGQRGQRETLRIVIALLVRALLGNGGAYELVDATRKALHGRVLASATGCRPVEIALERQDQGVFQYRLVFEATLPVMAGLARGVSLPGRQQEGVNGQV